jgi:4-hydroxy-tetrahydrodipicolinate synthase
MGGRPTKTIKNPVTGSRMPEYLTSVITPMFTPCNEDGSLDLGAIPSYVKWLKGTGAVTTLFVRSGVGKMLTFAPEEVQALGKSVIEEAAGEIHVLVGTSGDFSRGRPREDRYIQETVELTQFAQDAGASGAVVVPFGMDPHGDLDAKIIRFYEALNDSVKLPVVIYQPGMTPAPFLMKPEILEQVAKLPRIQGLKFSTDDMKRFGDLCEASAGEDFTMIAGAETSFLPALALGAGGVIGEGCNTYPQLLRAVFDSFMEGDLAAAAKAQYAVNKTLAVWSGMDSALVGKSYLARKGVKIKACSRRMRFDLESRLDRFVEKIDSAVKPYAK